MYNSHGFFNQSRYNFPGWNKTSTPHPPKLHVPSRPFNHVEWEEDDRWIAPGKNALRSSFLAFNMIDTPRLWAIVAGFQGTICRAPQALISLPLQEPSHAQYFGRLACSMANQLNNLNFDRMI